MHQNQSLSFPIALAGWLRFSGVICTDEEVLDALSSLVQSRSADLSLRRCVIGLAQDINPLVDPTSPSLDELNQYCSAVVFGFLQDARPVVPTGV